MRQAVMTSPGAIELREVARPVPGKGEVLLRIKRVGVCGSDIHVWHGLHPYTKYPVVQGHEVSGTIEEFGPGATLPGLAKGALATFMPQLTCGTCVPCRSGDYNICDSLRVMGDWYPSSGEIGLTQLLQREPALDAVFACNDPMALGALKAARRLGRRVPDDLAVAGYDDVPEASFFFPPLTTVRQPLQEMGKRGAQVLLERIANRERDFPAEIVMAPELVVRESTGPAPVAE